MITLNLSIHKDMLNFSNSNTANCVADIDKYFYDGDWCKVAPAYQTWPVLFLRNENHWLELKNLIIKKTSKYFNLHNCNCEAWAYVCRANEIQNQNYWHEHKSKGAKYSAVFYLDGSEKSEATEFLDKSGDVYRPKFKKNLLISFDSNIFHRPPIWFNQTQNRYVIAIDFKESI